MYHFTTPLARRGASALLASFAALNLIGMNVPSASAQAALSVSVDDVALTEGSNAVFTVSVSGNHPNAGISVDYETRDGSAVAGSDYTATTGTLNIPAGVNAGTITVPVIDDNVYEPAETFRLKLLGSSVTITDDLGVATITSNDPYPALSVRNARITEGDGVLFTNTMTFDVELTNPSNMAVSVDYATRDGSAVGRAGLIGDHDYLTRSGTLVFPAETNTTQQIAVPVKGDTVWEGDEQFYVDLSNPFNARIARATATGTIDENDPKPRLGIQSVASVTEGNGGTTIQLALLDVTLSGPSDQDTEFTYSTFDGTAHASGDYGAVSGRTGRIVAGSTSTRVSVAITGDTRVEPDENFYVTITTPSNAIPGNATCEVTILDDD